MSRPPHRPARQRGAALLTAMIIVTLIVTMAGAMVWQQWRAVQVEAAERARSQAEWLLQGALDWARLILREDARNRRPTALTEPWATPLQEARLSTFLAADNSNAQDAPDIFLSGRIEDLQARYNLNNLVDGDKLVEAEVATLQRLCRTAGVGDDAVMRIANGLRSAALPPGTANEGEAAPLKPRSVEQLAWFGLDEATVQRLKPYVVLLPQPTKVNVNTAAREVIASVVPGLDLASAERLVQARARTPFTTLDKVKEQLPNVEKLDGLGIDSRYFEVRGRLRLEDRIVEQRSVVERRGLDHVVILRELLPGIEAATAK